MMREFRGNHPDLVDPSIEFDGLVLLCGQARNRRIEKGCWLLLQVSSNASNDNNGIFQFDRHAKNWVSS